MHLRHFHLVIYSLFSVVVMYTQAMGSKEWREVGMFVTEQSTCLRQNAADMLEYKDLKLSRIFNVKFDPFSPRVNYGDM